MSATSELGAGEAQSAYLPDQSEAQSEPVSASEESLLQRVADAAGEVKSSRTSRRFLRSRRKIRRLKKEKEQLQVQVDKFGEVLKILMKSVSDINSKVTILFTWSNCIMEFHRYIGRGNGEGGTRHNLWAQMESGAAHLDIKKPK